ncbi:hypothetical protein [Flavobacterium johnsoniae]|uniref:Uncharacterized protein n=1 Tax=Flavobacterium johnsoniae TaxID=986 RepID=A0A1M5V757_FLAJO|nr:hypothetical protein [Flavobacterium johnsoniae]SHH71057.1 hypothetical protein SAMN05444388_11622 [Flavobacterium johnsoniae]
MLQMEPAPEVLQSPANAAERPVSPVPFGESKLSVSSACAT